MEKYGKGDIALRECGRHHRNTPRRAKGTILHHRQHNTINPSFIFHLSAKHATPRHNSSSELGCSALDLLYFWQSYIIIPKFTTLKQKKFHPPPKFHHFVTNPQENTLKNHAPTTCQQPRALPQCRVAPWCDRATLPTAIREFQPHRRHPAPAPRQQPRALPQCRVAPWCDRATNPTAPPSVTLV